MHSHFRAVADDLLSRRPSDMVNLDDVTNLAHVLRLAIKDNDALRQGFPVQDSADCLTLGDLDAIMDEIQDDDLRGLLNAKIARGMEKRSNADSSGVVE